ncbi:MAG: accessory factor UbiK family protein [Alphaproteobacteria bacterium]|nr:accessory factor UbiK family protein [Alphaproteobacteria bacterium]
MPYENRLFDDLARVADGAVGALAGVKDEIEHRLRAELERILLTMNLVPRDEFEAVCEMAVRAREENAALSTRIAALEAQLTPPPSSSANA